MKQPRARKLIKFKKVKVGDIFWWAGSKWRRGQRNLATRSVPRPDSDHDTLPFLDSDYVKI